MSTDKMLLDSEIERLKAKYPLGFLGSITEFKAENADLNTTQLRKILKEMDAGTLAEYLEEKGILYNKNKYYKQLEKKIVEALNSTRKTPRYTYVSIKMYEENGINYIRFDVYDDKFGIEHISESERFGEFISDDAAFQKLMKKVKKDVNESARAFGNAW